MPKRIDFKPGEVYHFSVQLDGENLIYLSERAKRVKRLISNESSFLINELLYEHRAKLTKKSVSKLSGNWQNQAEVTDKTFKK